MRPPAFLDRIHRWLFPDKRSEWERKRERAFIEAVNKLGNYYVTDRGGLSMDPEEISNYVIARRQELSHLVDPKYREMPLVDTSGLAAGACVEVTSWRRLNNQAAIRYVCLQAIDGHGFCDASARYFSAGDSAASAHDEERRIAQRLMSAASELRLEWHATLEAALEAHEGLAAPGGHAGVNRAQGSALWTAILAPPSILGLRASLALSNGLGTMHGFPHFQNSFVSGSRFSKTNRLS